MCVVWGPRPAKTSVRLQALYPRGTTGSCPPGRGRSTRPGATGFRSEVFVQNRQGFGAGQGEQASAAGVVSPLLASLLSWARVTVLVCEQRPPGPAAFCPVLSPSLGP